MQNIVDTILGVLKVVNLPETACFEGATFAEFVQKLTEYYAVEIPSSITNVVISAQQPGDDQTDSLWIRMDTSSNFIGLYIFAMGKWQKIYPVPSSLIWIYASDSRLYEVGAEPKTGYTLVWDLPNFPADQEMFLKCKSMYHNLDPATGWFEIFPVIYTGF